MFMEMKTGQDCNSSLYLIFHLDEQLYGAPVAGVREIIPMLEITPVPNSPAVIKGVINLRGSIVPIIDMRRKLKLKGRNPDSRSCIVVTDSPDMPFGFIADRVTDCLEISELSSPEEAKTELSTDRKFIQGIGQHDGHIVIILALDTLLSKSERKALQIT